MKAERNRIFLGRNNCCPTNPEDMSLVFVAVAFASMDAGAKPTTAMDGGSADLAGSKYLPGMYSRRATAANTEFMSGAIAVDLGNRLVNRDR